MSFNNKPNRIKSTDLPAALDSSASLPQTVAAFNSLRALLVGLGVIVGTTAPAPAFPSIAFGTYSYNTPGSVKQMGDWLYGDAANAAPGFFGDAHIGRGDYNPSGTFQGELDDWTGSVGYVIGASKWVGPGHTLQLAMPMFPKSGNFTDALAGNYNTQIDKILTDARDLLSPTQSTVYIRPGWEFNSPEYNLGGFQPWATGNNATKQAQYIQWFQYIVNRARVIWSGFRFDWIMNPGAFPFAPCYPGDAYVDRIGMDCYPGLNYKTVYRAPEVISPEAQLAIVKSLIEQQYGMQDARNFADARGKPFIIPEFAIEWDNGQVAFDYMWQWMLTGGTKPVASFAWWNQHDPLNVVAGISGVYKTDKPADGQYDPDLPNTGACIRYRFNPSKYPTQPQSPVLPMVNRLSTNLAAYQQNGGIVTAAVSGETDIDGRQVYKMRPTDTITNDIKRISTIAKCPLGVTAICKVAVQADTTGFAILNGPAGTNTGLYVINLSTGALAYYGAASAAKVSSVPVKRGNLWFFEITDKTFQPQVNPLLHMQPAAGTETAYIAANTTDGIKVSRLEILTF